MTPDQQTLLEAVFDATAQAMFDDAEVDLDSCGVNSFEACSALNVVAQIFGLRTVSTRYETLCEADG